VPNNREVGGAWLNRRSQWWSYNWQGLYNFVKLKSTGWFIFRKRVFITFIGKGPGSNILFHETFHITVNANGTMTVFFDNFSVECK
jgi:hypothetical protein